MAAARCLFCLQDDGGFTSEEHPVSESIGNTSRVIPRGIVCDHCNNGVLAVLDQRLAEFFPVKMRRTALGVPSKNSAAVPVTKFAGGGELRHNGRFGAIHGDVPRRAWTEEARSRVDPRYTIGMAAVSGGKPLRGRYVDELSRALLKVGFGCAWFEQRSALLAPEYDDVRDVILGTRQRERGYFFVDGEVQERNTGLNVSFDAFRDREGKVSLRVHANFYGVAMLTDSRAEEPPGAVAALGTTAVFDGSFRL